MGVLLGGSWKRPFKVSIGSNYRRLVLAAALACVLAAGVANPAFAADSYHDSDRFKIDTSHVDFGGGTDHYGGQPVSNGTMTWYRGDDGTRLAVLSGTQFLDNYGGGCARVRVGYYNSAGTLIGGDTSDETCDFETRWYGALDPHRQGPVSESFRSASLHHAIVGVEYRASRSSAWGVPVTGSLKYVYFSTQISD